MTRYLLLFDSYGLVFVGRHLWREDGSVFCICCWPLPAQSFLDPSPLVLATVFYCLRFETSQSQSHIATDGQSESLDVEPHMTTYLLLFDSYGLVLWGALSDERTGLSFIYAAGPCQRSFSLVRVPWDCLLSVVPNILNLSTRWRWVVSFTTQTLCVLGENPRYLRLEGRVGLRFGQDAVEKKFPCPCLGIEPQLVCRPAHGLATKLFRF
jgi:hypothetical protein